MLLIAIIILNVLNCIISGDTYNMVQKMLLAICPPRTSLYLFTVKCKELVSGESVVIVIRRRECVHDVTSILLETVLPWKRVMRFWEIKLAHYTIYNIYDLTIFGFFSTFLYTKTSRSESTKGTPRLVVIVESFISNIYGGRWYKKRFYNSSIQITRFCK
jgi:hypothetical protein